MTVTSDTKRTIETRDILADVDDYGDLRKIRLKNQQLSPLFLILLHRFINNRDAKILTTAKGNSTGMGKSTLATMLARTLSSMFETVYAKDYEWSAEKHAFIDGWEYLDYYDEEAQKGDVLIADEIQTMMDSRRSTTKRQVEFSQEWEKRRYKQVFTIGTLPGLHRVDLRVREDSDIWINITMPGRANVYYMTTNDFTGEPEFKRLKFNGQRVSLLYGPLDEDEDEDMRYMSSLKEKEGVNENQRDNGITEDDIKEYRESVARELIQYNEENDVGLTQKQLAKRVPKNPDGTGSMSQQYISHVRQEMVDDGVLENKS